MKTTKAVLGILAISLALAAHVQAQSFLTNGLIAYYPFTTDGKDQSGHGLDLILSNVVFSTVGSAGDMRPAASFDGVSSYGIVNRTLITGQTNWTCSAWLYSPPENPLEDIYAEGNQGGDCFSIDLNGTPGPGTLEIGAWNVGFPGNWERAFVPNVLTNGWNHLALTLVNGSVGTGTLSIFFNGVLTNTAVLQSVVPHDTSPRLGVVGNGWWIGNSSYPTAPWKGSMSDLRFYDRALPSNEVAQLYAIESAPPLSFLTNGLVAYYPFNGNANDESGRGNNGVVHGAVLTTNRFGAASSAYLFDGISAYIETINPLPDMQSASFSVWINVPVLPNAAVFLEGVGPTFTAGFAGFDFRFITKDNVVFDTAPLGVTDSWLNVVGVSDSSSRTNSLWLNGNLVAATSNQGNANVGSHSLLEIGRRIDNGSGDAYFKGSMSDLRFYNRGLTASEVRALYQYDSTPPPCVPYDATATASNVLGFVVSATVTDGGCGYTNTPSVRIIGGGGSGAEAVAVMTNGVVTAVNVTNAGSGYINPPAVVTAPPFIPQPTMGIVALPVITGSAAQIMQLGFGNLSPYDNYQLEFKPIVGGVWTNFALPFIPTSSVSTQEVVVTGKAGFFRVKYVP